MRTSEAVQGFFIAIATATHEDHLDLSCLQYCYSNPGKRTHTFLLLSMIICGVWDIPLLRWGQLCCLLACWQGRVRNRASLEAVPALFSSSENTGVLSAPVIPTYPNHSTTGTAMKEMSSVPPRPSAGVLSNHCRPGFSHPASSVIQICCLICLFLPPNWFPILH